MRRIYFSFRFLLLVYFLSHLNTITSQKILFLGKELQSIQWNEFQETIDCIVTRGSWNISRVQPILDPFQCRSQYGKEKCKTLNPINYEWNIFPNTCYLINNLQNFNQTKFVELIKGRNIMFIGDSMSDLMFATLMHFLHLNSSHSCKICSHMCGQSYLIPASLMYSNSSNLLNFTVSSFRNDRLSLTKSHIFNYKEKFIEKSFLNATQEFLPDLYILNRGSHYENDSVVLRQLNETLGYIFSRQPNSSVIWRNTARGHTNQEQNFTALPLHKPLPLPKRLPFHWREIMEQNIVIRKFLKDNYPQVLYFDILPSTELRIDAHVDGLHYCVNGPINNWIHMLYNILLIFEQRFV